MNCLQMINQKLCALLDGINNLNDAATNSVINVDLSAVVSAISALEATVVSQLNVCEPCDDNSAGFEIPVCGVHSTGVASQPVLSTSNAEDPLITSDNTLYVLIDFLEAVSLLSPSSIFTIGGDIVGYSKKSDCAYVLEVKPQVGAGSVEVYVPAGAVSDLVEGLLNLESNHLLFNVV
jgi:hypothetical protein